MKRKFTEEDFQTIDTLVTKGKEISMRYYTEVIRMTE